jgi:intein-encoded DNA endonuclease-like protein
MPNKINFNFEEVNSIINLYQSNISCKEIGKKYNCAKQTINKLLRENNIKIKNNSDCQKKYKINENIFKKIDSHEKAYWLGMLAGDGWVTHKHEIGLSLQEKDKEMIYKFRDFLESNHNIHIINNGLKKDGTHSISYEIRFTNLKMWSDLNKLGIIPNKTKNMEFPNLEENLLSSYMLGLVDSDGCFCLKKHYKIKDKFNLNFNFVGPTKFVEKFQEILIEKCKVSKTKLTEQSTSFIRVVNYGGYKHIFNIVKFLYSNSKIFLPRKKEIAIRYLLSKYPNDTWILNHL